VLKKINATGNPGSTLFNSECTISAGNTLRIGPDRRRVCLVGARGGVEGGPGRWRLAAGEGRGLAAGDEQRQAGVAVMTPAPLRRRSRRARSAGLVQSDLQQAHTDQQTRSSVLHSHPHDTPHRH